MNNVKKGLSDLQKPKDSFMSSWHLGFLPLTNLTLASVMDSSKKTDVAGLKDVTNTEDEVASNKDEGGEDLGTYVF